MMPHLPYDVFCGHSQAYICVRVPAQTNGAAVSDQGELQLHGAAVYRMLKAEYVRGGRWCYARAAVAALVDG